jgi:hypothetical protein
VEETFAVRGLLRLPLGVDYVEQAGRLRQLMLRPPISDQADLVLDDTGVGAAVGDVVIAAGNLKPVRVILTAGMQITRLGHRRYAVPKLAVVSNLDAQLNTGAMVFADDLAEREALRDELSNFQRHVTAAGRSIFEARGGKHDDIVLAIGLATWWAVTKHTLNKGFAGAVRGLG